MTRIELVDTVSVGLVNATPDGDLSVCAAAWVEESMESARSRATRDNLDIGPNARNEQPAKEKLIGYLIAHRHGTPFEHNQMTFWVDAPIFVWREFHRHRIGWSYNEVSGRYSQLKPRFWSCPPDRPVVPEPGYKSMRPQFVPGSDEQHEHLVADQRHVYQVAYNRYDGLLNAGIAKEVARSVLPVSIMSQCWVTCNARSLMAFLSLRTHRPDAKFVSFPQREIEQVAERLEWRFGELFPVTHAAFCKHGRVAP